MTDIEDRLVTLLERRASRVPVRDDLGAILSGDDVARLGPGPRRRPLRTKTMAAAAVLIIGAAGLAWIQDVRRESSTADSSIELPVESVVPDSIVGSEAAPADSVAAPTAEVACIPVARFRLDGIEYEVQTSRDVVAAGDVGELVAENLQQPPEIKECVPFFELEDGQTSLVSGTDVYTIKGVDPNDALTASDSGSEQPRYMRFVALP